MRILIAAVGKMKVSPEQQLYLEYTKRLKWKVECKEFDAKADAAAPLLAAAKGCDKMIALDESGKNLSSAEFADILKRWQGEGHSSFAFVIGGADGLHESVLKQSHLVWSLGKVTWPHMLVRALLAEQLYRAYSIITGHPYHRA